MGQNQNVLYREAFLIPLFGGSLFGGIAVLQTQIGLSSVLSKEMAELDNSVFGLCLLNQALQPTHWLLSTQLLQTRMEF